MGTRTITQGFFLLYGMICPHLLHRCEEWIGLQSILSCFYFIPMIGQAEGCPVSPYILYRRFRGTHALTLGVAQHNVGISDQIVGRPSGIRDHTEGLGGLPRSPASESIGCFLDPMRPMRHLLMIELSWQKGLLILYAIGMLLIL